MNNSWARPGVLCVCINDDLIGPGRLKNTYVEKGRIYKIVSIERSPDDLQLGFWGMPLNVTFTHTAFRPLVEISADADTAMFLEIAGHASDLESERA